MFRFLIGFILGIYVSMYGVTAVMTKFHDIYTGIVGKTKEVHEKSDTKPDINV